MFEEAINNLLDELDINYEKKYRNDIHAYEFTFYINDDIWIILTSNEKKRFLGGAFRKPLVLCNDEEQLEQAILCLREVIQASLETSGKERIVQ